MSTFQENLKKYREVLNINAKDFAALIGVNYSTYSNYENQGREPKYDTLCRIATALHVSIDDLLGHTAPGEHERLIEYARSCGLDVTEENGLVTVRLTEKAKQLLSDPDKKYIDNTKIENFPLEVDKFDYAIKEAEKEVVYKNTNQAILSIAGQIWLNYVFPDM